MRNSAFVLTLLLLSTCKKDATPPPPPAGAVLGPGATRPMVKDEGRHTLTEEKLTAFFDYQRKVMGLYSATMEDIARLDAQADAGALGGARAVADVLTWVDQRAKAEELARTQAGLTEEDVRAIEQMVSDVFVKRALAKTLNYESILAQFQKMKASLPADAREGMEKSIAEMRAQQQQLKQLAQEREKYGDANIELLLRREEELSRNWEALLPQTQEKRR